MTSPLFQWHEQAGGEFQDYSGTAIVSTYGSLPLEYAAMYRSAAVLDLAQRGIIAVKGADRHAFLNSILTAALVDRDSGRPMGAGQVRFSFLLSRQGRVLAEMNVFDAGEGLLLEMDRRLIDDVLKELERYHFRERVEIALDEDLRILQVLGPAAGKLIAERLGIDAAGVADGAGRTDAAISLWRMDIGAPAFTLVAASSELVSIWNRLTADPDGAMPAGWAAYNAVRIEAGRGLFGIDYDSSFLPAETGQIERGVSFTKGCYPGQEIVARMQSRGQWARRLVQLRLSSDAQPAGGVRLYGADEAEVGVVTSSTISPRHSGIAMLLAVVNREAIEAGGELRVPAEGAMQAARISVPS